MSEQLASSLRELTANLLRIARGSGKPEALSFQMTEALRLLRAFQIDSDRLLSRRDAAKMLSPEDSLMLWPG